MKTLIVYCTKYGTVEKCCQILKKELLGEVELCNLKNDQIGDLNDYQKVIIGGSIYIGQIQKEIKSFISTNLEKLLTKKVGLFICCARNNEIANDQLKLAYTEKLLNHSVVNEYFGGEITFSKMKSFDRFITKMVSKKDKNFPELDENRNGSFLRIEEIKSFASIMNRNGE